MRVLMLGDVFGRPGRRLVRDHLRSLREEWEIDFVVANGENAAGGAGLTTRTFKELIGAGVDVVTSGNHIYRHREFLPVLESEDDRVIRPANFSAACPGLGFTVRPDEAGRRVGVLNLQGRVYLPATEDPFAVAESVVAEMNERADVILVDIHAEATSEKEAMGWFLDGRVAVVAGTHTHVPTADERILEKGTAYITDLGMTGPHNSCLGVKTEIILRRFRTGMPERFLVASGDDRMQGAIIDVNEDTGLSREIKRIDWTGP